MATKSGCRNKRAVTKSNAEIDSATQRMEHAAERRLINLLGLADSPNPKQVILKGIHQCPLRVHSNTDSMVANERQITCETGQARCPFCRPYFIGVVRNSH